MATEPHSWDDDDDDRIGIPRSGRTITTDAPRPREEPIELEEEPSLREGDSELGRPRQFARNAAPLTDADRQRLRLDEEAQAQRELAEAEEMLASDPTLMSWAGWFGQPLAMTLVLATAGALGLFLYAQTLQILANLATQPPLIQYVGYGILGVFASAILYAILRLMFFYARLQRNRQIRIQGLESLQRRTRLRWLAHAHAQEARQRLEEYLRNYPINTPKAQRTLVRIGMSEATIAKLEAVRVALLDPARFTSTTEWFERFRDEFQAELDTVAEERIRYWSFRSMIVTAMAPNGLIDSATTLYFSFAMLGDMCQVYNLKAGRTGTAVLLARVFFNAYLSGQLNDLEKLAEDQYDHIFEQGFQVIGVGMSSSAISKLLGNIGAKATAGYLNRVLLKRLGRYAARLLRPVGV